MKNPSRQLYALVHALSRSEKRYFRLHASMQKGTKNYLKLFNAILMQSGYDEKAIKKMFRGERFARRLTYTKQYLYEMLLRLLESYRRLALIAPVVVLLLLIALFLVGVSGISPFIYSLF